MGTVKVRLDQIKGRSDEELKAKVREEIKTLLTPNTEEAEAHIAELKVRMTEYERRYEMPSAQMIAELEAGKIRHTHEIGLWAMDWQDYLRIQGKPSWFDDAPPPPAGRANGKRAKKS